MSWRCGAGPIVDVVYVPETPPLSLWTPCSLIASFGLAFGVSIPIRLAFFQGCPSADIFRLPQRRALMPSSVRERIFTHLNACL